MTATFIQIALCVLAQVSNFPSYCLAYLACIIRGWTKGRIKGSN